MAAGRPRKRAPAPGARRRARELALAVLYRADLLGLGEAEALASLPETFDLHVENWPPEDRVSRELWEEAAGYAARLVGGALREREAVDAAIGAVSEDWPIERLAATDRALLRLAVWELGQAESPPAVVVNEAVELAREYGEAESPKFVNGVLGAIVRAAEDG